MRADGSRRARRAALTWLVLAFVAFGWPSEALPEQTTDWQALSVHVLLFAVGTLLALRGWPHRPLRVVLVALVLAPLGEVWQAVLPTNRFADVYDAVANASGVLLGWALWTAWRRVKGRRETA